MLRKLFRKIGIGLLIFFGCIFLYSISFWNSIHKVDNFCNTIEVGMKMDELPALGNGEGVELRGPMTFSDASGNYLYAIAAGPFTMGEYACVIHG